MNERLAVLPGEEPMTVVRRWHVGLAGALLFLHGILVWNTRVSSITTGNDDAVYLLLSRSVRDLAYRDFHLLGAPGHSQYPPGFPTFLALFSLPFGERFDVLLAAIALCSVCALALLYDAIRRRSGPAIALTVLALCATNPAIVRYGGEIMSEAPYVLFATLAIWAILRESTESTESTELNEPSERRSWWPALAIGAAAAAALTRTLGITLLGALFLLWVLERRHRRALAVAVVGGLTAGSWILWTVLTPVKVVGRSYIADATIGAGGRPTSLVSLLAERAASNAPSYLTVELPWMMPLPTLSGTPVDNVVGVVALLALAAIGAVVLWKRARVVVIYVGVYAAVLTIWPWRLSRLLVPVLPFVLWLVIAGAFSAAAKRRWLRPLPFAVALAILAVALGRDVSMLQAATRCDRVAPKTSAGCFADVQRGFFAAARFVRHSTPDTSIFLTVKEGTLGYLTDRRAMLHSAIRARNGTAMLDTLRRRGIEFVVLSPLGNARTQNVNSLLQVCQSIEMVKEFAPVTYLLRVSAAGSPPPPVNACGALEQYEHRIVGLPPALDR